MNYAERASSPFSPLQQWMGRYCYLLVVFGRVDPLSSFLKYNDYVVLQCILPAAGTLFNIESFS